MSLEAAVAENTAALKEVAELLKASNAGREAAVAKLTAKDSGEADTPKTTRKKKDEPAPAPAATAPKVPTKEDLRVAAEKFLDENVVPKGSDERKARVVFIKSIIEHFGNNPDEPGLIGAVPEEHVPWAFEALGIKASNMASPVSLPAKAEEPATEDDEDDLGI